MQRQQPWVQWMRLYKRASSGGYLDVELGAVVLEEVEDGEEVVGVDVRVHQDPVRRRPRPARRGEPRHEEKQGQRPRHHEPAHPELPAGLLLPSPPRTLRSHTMAE